MDGLPPPSRTAAPRGALQVVPDQHQRAVELLVRGVQQPGVAGLGEALALIAAPSAGPVHPVDQPGLLPGLDRDQRGHRDPLVAGAGHRHYRGAATPSPGAPVWRPQALARFVLEDQPGAQVRRGPFTTGQVSSRQVVIAASSRSAARRAGTCTLQPIRCSSRSIPASV
jgi:hypothetical protein